VESRDVLRPLRLSNVQIGAGEEGKKIEGKKIKGGIMRGALGGCSYRNFLTLKKPVAGKGMGAEE
jgi:hypothetical protein